MQATSSAVPFDPGQLSLASLTQMFAQGTSLALDEL